MAAFRAREYKLMSRSVFVVIEYCSVYSTVEWWLLRSLTTGENNTVIAEQNQNCCV